MKATIIILAIIVVILLILLIREKLYSKFCWKQWNYFEVKFGKLYEVWIKTLTPEQLAHVQTNTINRDRDSFELEPPLDKPI